MTRNIVGTKELMTSNVHWIDSNHIPETESSVGAVPSTNEASKVRAQKTKIKAVTTLHTLLLLKIFLFFTVNSLLVFYPTDRSCCLCGF